MAMFLKQNGWRKTVAILLAICLCLGFSCFLTPGAVSASEGSIAIKVDGELIKTFTLDELQAMKPGDDEENDAWVGPRVYSTINTWPTKKWYTVEGVKLTALFDEAGIDLEDMGIQLIRVKATDGFVATFTKKELFDDTRYYYPGLKENHEFWGHVPGNPYEPEPEPVDAIIALRSVENSDNPDWMTPLNCPLLVFGQRWVTEQTNHVFAKNVGEIDLLTRAPDKWAKPTAIPEPGTVMIGTEVEFRNEFNDADKIYYTTDGTDPTLESPIFNWVASRWWGQREKELKEINKPIVITGDTIIKAKTIGFGREDSDIAVFEYKIYTVDVTGVEIVPEGDKTLEVGETVQLSAIVEPENATNKNVIWSTSDESVATVDETGLVTAVSEGMATITVTTEDGNFTDSIKVTVVPTSQQDTFEVENGVLIGYTGPGGDLIIPDDLNITSIGDEVFAELDTLTSVIIPEGVTSIGTRAFYKCTNLTSVTIPNSVKEIGDRVFTGCSSLLSITIPEGVTEIKDYTFNNCINLSEVTLPSTLTHLHGYAFMGCTSLASVTIPDNVTYLGANVFRDCSSLTEIIIPDSVEEMGTGIFMNCSSLANVTISKKLASIPMSAFSGCSSLTEVMIPEGVTRINLWAFENCSSLRKAVIPESVENIASAAFKGCDQLTIYGYKGSYAEIFAAENDIPFVALTRPPFKVVPEEDEVYIIGETADGIKTMTVNENQTGLKYFTVAIECVEPHEGTETVVFTHLRDGVQLQLNALEADFDEVNAAKAGFNIKPGDVIKVYIVDKLTSDTDQNPIILQ